MRSKTGVGRAVWLLGVSFLLSVLAACGGGDGGAPASGQSGSAPDTTGRVALAGKASFDHVPNVAGSLRYDAVQVRPIEGATLEVIDASTREVLATTQTADLGTWSTTVPAGRSLRVRVKAQMVQSGRWQVEVLDNTQSGALYAIESEPFDAARQRVDVHAASGWTGQAYGAPRAAAPFAILATVRASQATLLAVDHGAVFPPLAVYWSPDNFPAQGERSAGHIGGTHFRHEEASMAIYLLGAENVDTDEYDESVVAHEWGHYYQAVFSRNDSLGGPHDADVPLEMTVAFSEGWGDGWQAIALGRTDYADSFGERQALPDVFQVLGSTPDRPGWFSERSVATVVAGLAAKVGVGPLHQAMQDLRGTPALTTIHAFAHALRRRDAAAADQLDTLLRAQKIVASRGSDEFGSGETNGGGLNVLDADNPGHYYQPLYLPLADDPIHPVQVCSASLYGNDNKHGLYRALRFDAPAPGRYALAVWTPDTSYSHVTYLSAGRRIELRGAGGVSQWVLDLPAGPFVLSVADGYVRESGSPQDYECPVVLIRRLATLTEGGL